MFYTTPQPDMFPEFYSLGILVNEFYARRASSMREAELVRASVVQRELAEESNQ